MFQKVRNNPRDASFADVRQLLLDAGFGERQPKSGSSHVIVQIQRVPEGYCASIPLLKGCKAFGETAEIALREVEAVKEGFIEVFLEMGKPIPEPVVHLDIPYPIFQQLDNRKALELFVVG